MCKFVHISNYCFDIIQTLHYMQKAQTCYRKYFKYLQDDFSPFTNLYSLILVQKEYFWLVLDNHNEFMGFVYLDNFIGDNQKNYSVELTTCFDKCAWGNFTRYSAKFFLKKCFDDFGLEKIKAQIYPDNFRVKNLLKDSGFIYETTLKKETLRFGKPQDIEVYSLYKSYYYGK